MKKIYKIKLVILILIITFSCNESDSSIDENTILNNFELIENVKLHESTTFVSDDFLKMGVSKIIVNKNSEATIFKVKTEKSFILNGEMVNLSNFNIIFKNGMLYMKNDAI